MSGTTERPIIALAIEPRTRIDRERLDLALRQFVSEDPTLRVRTDRETGQRIVAGMSERQLAVIIARLTGELGVDAAIGNPTVVYKEMLTRAADGEGKFVSHTGGRGQYAHVRIHVLPGESGSGYVFSDATYDGSVPKQFIGAVKEGIGDALIRRSAARHAFDDGIDVRIELYDGSYHDVDSSEEAFRTAGAMALEDAMVKAAPVLLEPIMIVETVVPSEHADDAIDDLVKRRAIIEQVDTRENTCVINARVPLSTILGYESDLRSRTRNRGACSMEFDRYEPCDVRPDIDEDDRVSPVRAPRNPTPRRGDSAMHLPEPDEDDNSQR